MMSLLIQRRRMINFVLQFYLGLKKLQIKWRASSVFNEFSRNMYRMLMIKSCLSIIVPLKSTQSSKMRLQLLVTVKNIKIRRCLVPKNYIVRVIYVILMKTQQTLNIKNRHLISQIMEEKTPSLKNSPQTPILPTLNEKCYAGHPSQTSTSDRITNKYWNEMEQRLFTEFWLQKFIQNPCQNFSLDAPLSRKCHNKQASDYIRRKSQTFEIECQKSAKQCKSKFGTIRRNVLKQRKSRNSQQSHFGFIDFIIQKAENFKPRETEIDQKIQQVRALRSNQGPFVKITIQEYKYQKSQIFRETFILLSQFISNNQRQPSANTPA